VIPSKRVAYIFIVSMLAETIEPQNGIVIHLVRKRKAITISQVCLAGGNGYGEVQIAVEKMILKEFSLE
jgi:hypothetical protein